VHNAGPFITAGILSAAGALWTLALRQRSKSLPESVEG
jgi:hypothetical protein